MSKPIVDSPNLTAVKFVREVHSGEEHRTMPYKAGETADLPPDLADILVSTGAAELISGSGAIEAKKRGKKATEAAVQAAQKRAAQSAQMQYDDLPSEIRALAQEHGDDVIALYQQGETVEAIVKAYGGQ